MQQNLESIDWNGLGAANIPQWLQGLISDNPKSRAEAFNNLDTKVVNLGSESWESFGPLTTVLKDQIPYLIIPFLIDFLTIENVKNKDNILILLYDLSRNISENINSLTEPYKTRAEAIFSAILKGTDTYRSFLSSESPSVQAAATDLLKVIENYNIM